MTDPWREKAACAGHPPTFDPAAAVELAVSDRGACADYVRALLGEA